MVVKRDGKESYYCAPIVSHRDESGKWVHRCLEGQELEQANYQSLIDDIRREEFEKAMKSLILGYKNWDEKEVDNIKIVITGSKGHCEMNIGCEGKIEKLYSILNLVGQAK